MSIEWYGILIKGSNEVVYSFIELHSNCIPRTHSHCLLQELLGVTANKLMRLDVNNGDHIKTWRFNSMKTWKVNWEIRQMLVSFEEEDVQFSVLSADCKVVHEFIGGYIFLSMRSKEANQSLDEELFHKLTSGW